MPVCEDAENGVRGEEQQMKKHYSPEELKRQIRKEAAAHRDEAVEQAADMITPEIYAAIALAIAEDPEDQRTYEEKQEYIERIFMSSQEIWTRTLQTGKQKPYREILKELKEKTGIVVRGM